MKKLFFSLSILCLVASCYDDTELRERLDKLENATIPTLNEQLISIGSSIATLREVDSDVKAAIEELKRTDAFFTSTIQFLENADEELLYKILSLADKDATQQTLIEALQKATEQNQVDILALRNKDEGLEARLEALQAYLDASLKYQHDWVDGTFATLEQYNAVTKDITAIQEELRSIREWTRNNFTTLDQFFTLSFTITEQTNDLEELKRQLASLSETCTKQFDSFNSRMNELEKKISWTDASLRTWVGEQFTNYYDIAAVDARIGTLNESIVKGDEALSTEIASVRISLEKAKTDLTSAYQSAIKKAIEENNGVITKQIATEIATVNSRIDEQVSRLDARIDAVEVRVSVLEEKMEALLKTLDLTFNVTESIAYSPGTTVTVNYTLTNADENTTVECITDAGFTAVVTPKSVSAGSISVTTPATGGTGKVLVFANKGDRTVMRALYFEQGVLQIVTDVFTVEPNDTIITIEAQTNIEYSVSIPQEAQSWITLQNITTRATMRTDAITLKVSANPLGQSRSAVVFLLDEIGNPLSSFLLYQRSNVQPNNEIWYISTDGNIIEPATPRGFGGRNIVSNTYSNGKGVMAFDGNLDIIGPTAFSFRPNLLSITLPESITLIGSQAFSNCKSLSYFIIPKSVKSIGYGAFQYCSSIADIIIPENVTSIGYQAFQECSNLTSIILPESITTIDAWTFYQDTRLVNITIPESVTCIGQYAFQECSSLTSIIIPKNVKTIETHAFWWCSNVTDITISEGVTTIGKEAMSMPISSIVLPSTLEKMYGDSFSAPLEEISSLSITPPFVSGSFSANLTPYCTLYVPKGCKEAYSAADGWKDFKEIIELE